ncbi:PHP domain-containing protein [Sedimentibacter sp. zth1]|uniref:PHP domain-containing protein n=1 Tax=Sedimentibacter sp. zth1 TaxID=2816908 RepID=UPI001A939FB4|nr:PHP domain-containing protein [Sedimentibacter sp. zth1]QSX05314.1 PHP domain-containing protein [Sedimentibacter sp. zth1]
MRVTKDYHVHSKFSHVRHAKNTVEEIVNKAIEVGLKEIAITNHGLSHITYGIRKRHLLSLRKEINELQMKYPNIKILLGVEANILSLNGDIDVTQDIIDNCDIVLCGYHTFVGYKTFKDFWSFMVLNKLAKKFGWFVEKQRKSNTQAIVKAMESKKINILTHPGEKLIVDIEKIAKSAEKNSIILEINSSHKHLSTEELKVCKLYDIKYIINSDSHSIDTIGDYKSGIDRAVESNINLKEVINLEI